MDADEIERSLVRIAHQILETNKGADNLALVGIVTRGDLLASAWLRRSSRPRARRCRSASSTSASTVTTFYSLRPEVHSRKSTSIWTVKGRRARRRRALHRSTIRAALDALMDTGRPARVELAVLVTAGIASFPSAQITSARTCLPPHRERAPVPGGSGRQVRGRDSGMSDGAHISAAPLGN